MNSNYDLLGSDIRKIDIKTADTFHGNGDKVDAYVAEVRLYLDLRGRGMNDRFRVVWAASYLRGKGGRWWQAYYVKSEKDQPEWAFNLSLFLEQVKRMFGAPDRHRYAVQRLKRLCQDKSGNRNKEGDRQRTNTPKGNPTTSSPKSTYGRRDSNNQNAKKTDYNKSKSNSSRKSLTYDEKKYR
ncbi:hypothetical protein TREMEDRAFT_64380 [Tremella mesenterica DSM 1558]|uniref:uncharacterized protein n=1 Tax=Tremella mesenterica (strain ATCC 24925 / CBS 8224 / DSM 1558 / NBRC 9311 / NRRL Y-6157 / RJB 2259-6 / UBC 559-6) TaxID=578456 RepID=UPI0003F49D9F|nr:uncharacterized protein TREMEDRAFT_64380 [Tremella mesenterica DSM 1558]EIW67784.1 hypothetical protein TREMEDRAFT_64380 [Tremella mesenterica DSM 1558]